MDYRDRIRAIINHATGCPENWCPDDRRCVELVDEMANEIERLREAAQLAIQLINANLYHQREKVQDAASLLRQALEPI